MLSCDESYILNLTETLCPLPTIAFIIKKQSEKWLLLIFMLIKIFSSIIEGS